MRLGDVVRELAGQFLALAEKQEATIPLMVGHRLMATTLLCTGDIADGLMHYNQALALYDPTAHRPLATRFGQDVRMASLCYRSLALWFLGYPEAALADVQHALKDAREIGLAATLMSALTNASMLHIFCGHYPTANAEADELSALAEEKSALFWKAFGMINQGRVWAMTGKASDAVRIITSGITAYRSTGATLWMPTHLSYLTRAYVALGQFDDAWRSIGEAVATIEATKGGTRPRSIARLAKSH